MSKLKPMSGDEHEAYVQAAEGLAQGIGLCDNGELPAQFNDILSWLALDDADPRKRRLDEKTLLHPTAIQATVEHLTWLVLTLLTLMFDDAKCDRETWDVLRRIVDVAIQAELRGRLMPTPIADVVWTIALAMEENIVRPEKHAGAPRGIRGIDDPRAQDKIACVVETITLQITRNGHRGGAYTSKASASKESRRRTAAGIVQTALERLGLKVSYARIVDAVKQYRKKAKKNG